MKNTSLKVLMVTLLFGCCSLSSCQENKKGNSPEMNSGQDGVATISLEDGREIEFEATFSTVQTPMGLMIGLSNPRNGMLLLLSVRIPHDQTLETKQYKGQLTMNQQTKDDILKEKYRSFYHENPETGETGNATITLTEVSDNHVSGTFSGTLYSESGKKAFIEGGKFSVEMD